MASQARSLMIRTWAQIVGANVPRTEVQTRSEPARLQIVATPPAASAKPMPASSPPLGLFTPEKITRQRPGWRRETRGAGN